MHVFFHTNLNKTIVLKKHNDTKVWLIVVQKQHAEEIGKLEAARRSLKEQLDELYKKMEAERTDLLNRIEKVCL